MKKIIIVGSAGQDGSYLYEKLSRDGHDCVGIERNNIRMSRDHSFLPVDILNQKQIEQLIQEFNPDELYYLAAFHQSSEDKNLESLELIQKSIKINVKAFSYFLSSLKQFSPDCRTFYAASSHIFGSADEEKQNEATAVKPECVYGITKNAAMELCRYYRENHHLYISVGILYNHESSRRLEKFISKKIVKKALAIKAGQADELIVGNLKAQIDWGFAPDFVNAMVEILKLPEPDEFIISSGELHSVEEFISVVFKELGLDWKRHVKENPGLITKKSKKSMLGDASKLQNATKWKPTVSFDEMIRILIKETSDA